MSDGRVYTYTWSNAGQLLAERTQSIATRVFTYTAAGQLAETSLFTLTTRLTYNGDDARRVVNVVGRGATTYTFAYAYDAVGNRTAQTQTLTNTLVTNYVYDAANRLTSVNGQGYTWDNNGNLTNDGSKVYTYTQANRLSAVTASGLTWSATYNGDGARLRQVTNGTPTTYTQDLAAPLPVVLQAKTGVTTTQYLFAMGTRPLAEYDTGWEYLLPDGLGSVRQLADGGGFVGLSQSYEPYGSLLSTQGSASSIFGFAGEQTDTGLVFLRARYMQPTLGMFLSRDPWEGDELRPRSLNGWNYAEGNPINLMDPSGRKPAPPPYIPYWNGVHPLQMNGYIEGESLSVTAAANYIHYSGSEIVYDFVTHERARFNYSGYISDWAWCGLNTSLYEGTTSSYAGWYEFWNNPIEQEYGGPFANFTANLNLLSLLGVGGAIGSIAGPWAQYVSVGAGWTLFCGAPTEGLVPGVNLSTAQCGVGVSLSGGGSKGLPTGKVSMPVGIGVYFTKYKVDGTVKQYAGIDEMAQDIRRGAESPMGLIGGLAQPARDYMAETARTIWMWQDLQP